MEQRFVFLRDNTTQMDTSFKQYGWGTQSEAESYRDLLEKQEDGYIYFTELAALQTESEEDFNISDAILELK
jgi:hypothetical protein